MTSATNRNLRVVIEVKIFDLGDIMKSVIPVLPSFDNDEPKEFSFKEGHIN